MTNGPEVPEAPLLLWRAFVFKSLYVDDLLSGGPTIEKAKQLKRETTEIFADAKFELHKWHSNRKELQTACEDYEPPFAKEQLENTPAKGECKLLSIGWDKFEDTLYVCFPATPAEQTRHGILTNLAKVYDPLGVVSPVMLGDHEEMEKVGEKST